MDNRHSIGSKIQKYRKLKGPWGNKINNNIT